MAGNVGQVERHTSLIHTEIVDKITRQVQRRDDLVGKLELVNRPGAHRQHVHLHLAPGVLVFLEQVQAGFEFAVGGLELFAVALVFQEQACTVQGAAHRVLQHGQVFQGLDQVIGGAQAQGFNGIVHDTGTGHDKHRRLRGKVGHLANQLQAAHLGHAQVADHKVGLVALEYLKTLLAITGLQDAEATVFQVGREARAHYFVVIDNQQRGTGFLHVGKRRQN
ncbi:hypothetical protein PFLmoz3_03526 [Pseudomonas fluorescens]|uniref:Uncharacterized protein n=1 Tax=Pseudomonas fluorescens TaxID=294 RepID=A0A120G766_PSEFL|nr:hypothetical protein PFLmoz3_03526 [Pseudomonas fluorescens]